MFKRLLIMFWVAFAVVPALAQNVPDPINAALKDLSTRVNRTVTLTQVTEWNYQQSVYPSPALGCPQPGIAYTDVLTSGFQFIITYEGTVYDYRVSDDKSIIVLCGTAPAPASVPPCPPPDDSAFLTPRLGKGVKAQVVAGGLPNVIREQPGSSSKLLGQIPPGDSFIVIDGPRCTLLDKIVWWQINYNNLIGWTGEGQGGDYWLEPTDIALTPTVPAPELSPTMAINDPFALSPDGRLYASISGNTITVTNINTQTTVNTFDNINPRVISFAFNAAGAVLAAGMENGEIWLFDLKASSPQILTLRTGSTGAVNVLAFSPDGSLLASGGADQTLRIWDTNNDHAALASVTTTHNITSLAFTSDGSNLIVHDENGGNMIYAVKTEAVG